MWLPFWTLKRQCHDNRWFFWQPFCVGKNNGGHKARPRKTTIARGNYICSTQLGRWSCSRDWPSWCPRHLREQLPFFARAKKAQKNTEYRDTASLKCYHRSFCICNKQASYHVVQIVCLVKSLCNPSRLNPYSSFFIIKFLLFIHTGSCYFVWGCRWAGTIDKTRNKKKLKRKWEGRSVHWLETKGAYRCSGCFV